jgi:putative membrane protein
MKQIDRDSYARRAEASMKDGRYFPALQIFPRRAKERHGYCIFHLKMPEIAFMRINFRVRVAMLAFIAIAGGCNDPAHEAGRSGLSLPQAAAHGSTRARGQPDSTDAAFLREAVQGNEQELAMVALARKRGSPAIDGLAKTLQRDHTLLRGALAPLAGGIPAPAVSTPAELGHLDGTQFDARFLTLLRDQYALSTSKFEMAASDTALSDDVRKLASDTLPTLHRNLARIKASQGLQPDALARNP